MAYVSLFTSVGGWIWDNAIKPVWDWVSGIFGFGEDDETDAEKEKFSLFQLIKDAAAGAWAYLKGLFTFSPDTMKGIKDSFSNIGNFISAIKAGAKGAVMNLFSPIDGFMNAFNAKLAEGGLLSDSQISSITVPSDTTTMGSGASTLANQTAQMNASTGGVTVIDQSTKTSSNNTTQDTYNQQELSSDHNESSGSWWSRVDLTPWN